MAELEAKLVRERLRERRKNDLVEAHNDLFEATHRCTWSQSSNQETYLPREENESWDAWFARLDPHAVGTELVCRWPSLIAAIHDNAPILGYDAEEFVAFGPTAPLDRDSRATFTARQFQRIWKSPKDKKLLGTVAEEVGKAFRRDKKWTIEWYHWFFDCLHAKVRQAYDAALRKHNQAVAAEVSQATIRPEKETAEQPQRRMQEPKHAEDYSWLIDATGQMYIFTPQQRAVIKALYEEWASAGKKDGCGLSTAALAERVDFHGQRFRVSDLFRNSPAKGSILRETGKKGVWALYLSAPSTL